LLSEFDGNIRSTPSLEPPLFNARELLEKEVLSIAQSSELKNHKKELIKMYFSLTIIKTKI